MIGGVKYAVGDDGWFVALRHEAEYFQNSPLLRVDLVYVNSQGEVAPIREIPFNAWAVVAPNGTRIAFPDGTLTGNAIMLDP